MNDTQFEGFADIVAFTYSETTEPPEPKRIAGTFIWVLGFSVLILLFKLIAFWEERSERKKTCKSRTINEVFHEL